MLTYFTAAYSFFLNIYYFLFYVAPTTSNLHKIGDLMQTWTYTFSPHHKAIYEIKHIHGGGVTIIKTIPRPPKSATLMHCTNVAGQLASFSRSFVEDF